MTPARIKAIRTRLGVSQETLSRMLDVGVVTVNRWEAGKTPVQHIQEEMYEELSLALDSGVTPARILEMDRKHHRRLRFYCRVHAAAGEGEG